MQPIAELAKQAKKEITTQPSATESSSNTTKQLPKLWQTALFDRFSKIYRHKFSDQFANVGEQVESMHEWGEALAHLSGKQIKLGLDQSRKLKTWPPSISEFLELAESRRNWEHKTGAYKIFQKSLPKPVNRDIGRDALSNLNNLFEQK